MNKTALLPLLSAALLASSGFSVLRADPAAAAPEMQAVLDKFASLDPKPIETLDAKEARKQPAISDAVTKIMKEKKIKPIKPGHIENTSIDGPDKSIKIRIYSPKGDGPFPVIVYYHGGGFVIADLDTYDATPRALCEMTGAVVVSCHYRQGPEAKFPAAHDDALAAYQWVTTHTDKLKGDPKRIAVVGESAGGNLANAVSMMARDKSLPVPIYQVLVYPVVGADMNTPSYQENANAKPLNKAMMKWFFDNETVPSDASDPRLTPLAHGNLTGLPPTTVITDQIDPLRSEGEAYAKKLQAAGIKVSYHNYDAVTHEFFGMGAIVPQAKEAETQVANDLKSAFGGNPSSN